MDRARVGSAVTSAVLGVASAAASADLIHHYPMVGDVSDVVGNAHGTLVNGAAICDGALCLDGVDDYVQIDLKIVPRSGSYSVAMFYRQDSMQMTYVELISQGFSGAGFYVGHDPSRRFRVTDQWGDGSAGSFPPPGDWHHLAVTVDADANLTTLYVDGQPVNTRSVAIATTDGGDSTRFGRQFDPFEEFLHGLMDDIRIYDHALSREDVAELAGVDACPADLDGSGNVDFDDLLGILAAWGNKGGPEDLDEDGIVSFGDLLLVLTAWGPCE